MTWRPETGHSARHSILPLILIIAALTIGFVSGLGGSASPVSGGMGMFLLIIFLLVGGQRAYGWAGVAVFTLAMYGSAFGLEALSIATGFPFGSFQHNGESFKLLGVPPVVPMVYAVAGWTAWVLARQILVGSDPLQGSNRVVVPLAAALILAGYDAVIDPVGGTIEQGWTYAHAGGLSGVPLTNFCGWIFTGFVGFALFSFAEGPLGARRSAEIFGGSAEAVGATAGEKKVERSPSAEPAHLLVLLVPAALWLGMALPSFFPYVHEYTGEVSAGASTLAIVDIRESAAIVALFSMVLPTVIAVGRVLGSRQVAVIDGRGRPRTIRLSAAGSPMPTSGQ